MDGLECKEGCEPRCKEWQQDTCCNKERLFVGQRVTRSVPMVTGVSVMCDISGQFFSCAMHLYIY